MGLALHKPDDLSEQDYLEGEKTSTIKYEYIFLVPKLRLGMRYAKLQLRETKDWKLELPQPHSQAGASLPLS